MSRFDELRKEIRELREKNKKLEALARARGIEYRRRKRAAKEEMTVSAADILKPYKSVQ